MKVKDFTNRKATQLLATQSRRADIGSIELGRIHFEMGKLLAYEILEDFELKELAIQHVQGVKTGVELVDKNNLTIIAMMRAGLYAAEGIRSVFSESAFLLYKDQSDLQLDWTNKTAIVVDAVINSGKSVERVIEYLQQTHAKKIIIATLILQKDALRLAAIYPDIKFYASRISENKYVGKGGTDTGNRLFNTIN